MISVVADVTESKKSERDRRFFMELLENTDDVAVMKDTQLRYVGVNRACLQLFGLDGPGSVIGKTDEELFRGLATPQEIAAFSDNDGQAMALPRGQSLVVEEQITGADGIQTFLTRKFPIYDEKGEKILGTGTLSSEISDRKRMEEELRLALRRADELRSQAQAATEAKSAFLAVMSHEIRTPLNGIIGFLDLLSETDLTPLQRDHLSYAEASAQSLLAITGNVLDISKIEAGALELESLTTDLAATVRQALAIAHYGARAKGIELRLKIADDVPPYIVTDPLRLHQVLVNLVGNGVKFTEKGFVEVAVTFQEDGGRGAFSFSVTDTGIGIGTEQKRRLFKAFAQGDSSTARHYGGTGLGLAIAAGILERMGSALKLESRPGEGSCFSFTLVADGACGEPPGEGKVAREDLTVIERERPPIIVIADDIEPNRRLIGELLRTLLPGASLFEAVDGREALEFFLKENPDLIAMDLKMPLLDGLEAADLIRREGNASGRRRTPIVAVTADTQATTRRESLESGIDAFLTKPVDGRELRRLLERFLGEPRGLLLSKDSHRKRASGPPGLTIRLGPPLPGTDRHEEDSAC
ncbi:PAS domain-containing hybrid sensor histidine kinase/response regulator [Aminirod propionatiphilus]|uniref:Response regulator n=1 Tax=Aminirod propionatiphilus TaxID=3415223 RepID=A0ACD1DYH8_9BACT|nr:response regulator [Synergistota bacterium]